MNCRVKIKPFSYVVGCPWSNAGPERALLLVLLTSPQTASRKGSVHASIFNLFGVLARWTRARGSTSTAGEDQRWYENVCIKRPRTAA